MSDVSGATERLSFAAAMRRAMAQVLSEDDSVFAYGEGINDPNGFFGTTAGLAERFGADRCLDVPNSEDTLAGFGLGAALCGMRPVFVNLRTEFLLLAVNQLVNHAAKWPSMHGSPLSIPLTVRAMVGRGWGQGAQHSGSYAAMLAHVPGLQVVVPSSPARGAGLLVAAVRGDVPTVLIEPKAIYEMEQDVDLEVQPIALGRAFIERPGVDITLVAIGDAVGLALAAAADLEIAGVSAEVIDLCSLQPFDEAAIVESVRRTTRCGVIDMGWADYGVAAQVAKALATSGKLPLQAPLLSWAPVGHAPAGCFAEASHYPTAQQVIADVLAVMAGR